MQIASETRRAWITGAGKGIGRDLALSLSAEGWTVAASSRTAEDLAALALAAAGHPGRIVAYPLDVTVAPDVASVAHRIERDMGALDLVVLNAGTHAPGRAKDFDLAAFRTVIETNLMGVANGLAAVLPKMVQRRSGHVAVVASVAGYRGLPTAGAYGASKAALINLCEALYPELKRSGVRLTLINPGFVATPLTAKNRFPMPFLISTEAATRFIRRGLDRGAFEVVFPRRMALAMKLLRYLPNRALFAVTGRFRRDWKKG